MSLRSISLYLFTLILILAGINHFAVAEIYLSIIPHYMPWPEIMNYFSGAAEVMLGIMLLFNSTRKIAAALIITMLIAFIPAHIYMIQIAPFYLGSIYVSKVAAWLRLPLQAVFVWWAYQYYK